MVSHSGNWADGDFLQSLNLTDIHTGWVESRAVVGKTQRAVRPQRSGKEINDLMIPLCVRSLNHLTGFVGILSSRHT